MLTPKGPPSKTGNSAIDPPGPSTASTCSRPDGEVLKIRTRPKTTMYKPERGSPSEKSISPGLQDRMAVRETSALNSRVGQRGRQRGFAKDINWRRKLHAEFCAKTENCLNCIAKGNLRGEPLPIRRTNCAAGRLGTCV